MHSVAAPVRQTATRRPETDGSTRDIASRLRAFPWALALVWGCAAMPVQAQENGGAIMISGPGETNPAAVVAMAKNAGMNVNAAPMAQPMMQPPGSAQPIGTPSPRGYARAVNGANAAMRAAALALDARADAADASSSSADSSGMIVIPGNGEAKPAPQPRLAMTPSQSTAPSTPPSTPQSAPAGGMIEIPGNGEPSTAAVRPLQRVAVSARDVTPVIVQADDPAKQDAVVPNRMAARGFQARPIAAAPAVPVAGGMMAVSMRPAAPIRAPLTPGAATVQAPQGAQPSQDGDSIRAAALAFLTQEAAGLPGKADITVTPVFPRGLAPCATLEPFMPPGARLWGRTTVGVRCTGDRPWTLYLQARVSLQATYYLAARAMAPGEVLTAADLSARDGDITSMPQAIVTDPSQAVGATTLSRIVAGLPLRTDMLRGASSVVIGSSVHVVTSGAGFSISAEGSAMNNAAPGQQVRVKTAGGQIITGIVKDSSTVEVQL
ncbi:flagellar basal body P-ring formation chaperone FlgA [Caballeronia sp. DA-9]|uniref:flagellar basal body P-ring formation chaperone FlgA n=1 Tax=Caballeronia sp. DA-9 TaxID=3436237 RepID=UPI003F66C525